MLPPPTTSPIWTPRCCSPCSSSARAWMRSRLIPYSASPARISPESFSRMRRNLISMSGPSRANGVGPAPPSFLLAQLEAREAPHGDVLAQLGDRGLDALLHRHLRVLDERLLEEHDILVQLLDTPGDHLLDDSGGRPRLRRLGGEDGLLALEDGDVELLPAHAERARGRD